jgi:hypothetical protein
MSWRVAVLASSCAILFVPAAGALIAPSTRQQMQSTVASISRYGVFERSFHQTSSGYANPWEQVSLAVTFTSPSGRRTRIGGFYAGPDTWKVRFSPAQKGRWRWEATLADSTQTQKTRGTLVVVGGTGHGFADRSPYNRFRWTFADGSPYYPLGIGDCVLDVGRSGSPFDDFNVDATRGPVDVRTYLSAYQAAGVNLFRWSVDNCAFGLYQRIAPEGNVYLEREGDWGDRLVSELRSHGLRVYMSIFGFNPPFVNDPSPEQLNAVERYVKYVVDRYGAYVDFWELMNEAKASAAWYTRIATYLRSVDPYHHPIATSYERPDLPVIDVNSPHWYERESEPDSDLRTWNVFTAWKSAGKPVIVGEQGNSGQNWDERSAVRMRLRAWTAFFAEGTIIFWNTSGIKNYRSAAANIYLGPEERGSLNVLQRFTQGFDPRARIVPINASAPATVRGYALSGPREFGAYLHAFRNQAAPTTGVRLTIRARSTGSATWIDPVGGRVLARSTVRRGTRQLVVPPFLVDVALKIRFSRALVLRDRPAWPTAPTASGR